MSFVSTMNPAAPSPQPRTRVQRREAADSRLNKMQSLSQFLALDMKVFSKDLSVRTYNSVFSTVPIPDYHGTSSTGLPSHPVLAAVGPVPASLHQPLW
jgi:hypothetical protein